MGGKTSKRTKAELVSAIRGGDVERVGTILKAQPELLGDTVNGRSWLHHATDWPGNWPNVAETITLLIELGADVNARFPHPDNPEVVAETPLHWAASCGNIASVALLLEAGAAVDALGGIFGGCTAFEEAIIFEHYVAALLLQDAGAAQYLPGAAALGQMTRVNEFFTAEGKVRFDVGMLPHWKSPPPAQTLLDRGFQFACRAGHVEIAALLRRRGADISAITPAGTTALDEARKNDHEKVVAQLLEWGVSDEKATAVGA